MIKIIIGSGYGDEGKGLMTDFFSNEKSVVVRFNGGAQAGHTVVRNGIRHVFHHFGSGTLAGAQTYLSKFFIVNPVLYFKEQEELQKKIPTIPQVFIDPECIVTTPYDMMLNEIIEDHRQKKHGSCGCGVNETVERNKTLSLKISDNIENKLIEIRDEYVPKRLKEFSIEIPDTYREHLKNDRIIERFKYEFESLKKLIISDPNGLLQKRDIIFEGAQGLMLDQDHEFFPHVTRSSTGVKNVTVLLKEFNLTDIPEICYVTRCYSTRHGEGPFPQEIENKPFQKIVDETNITNKYQGALRFGLLNLDILKRMVKRDLWYAPELHKMSFAVTCLDQVDMKIPFILENIRREIPETIFIAVLAKHLNTNTIYASYSSSNDKILKVDFK